MLLTRLLIGVNFVLRQCIQVVASPSGTHTAACSLAGCLLARGRGQERVRDTCTVNSVVNDV